MRTIPLKESITVEFKSDIIKYPDSEIFEAVVAFANTEGGDLYLGVEDDGKITGVNKAHSNPVSLGAFISNHTIPPVSTRSEIIDEEKPVLMISVPKSYNGIVATTSGKVLRRRIKADGTPENIPMYPSEFFSRISDLRLLDYSAMMVEEASVSDFDAIEIERLRRTILAYDGDKSLLDLSDEELFKALGFVKEQNDRLIPTIAGILMIGRINSLKRFVPTMKSSFQVLEGTEVRVNEDFAIPVLAAIERINQFFEAWNPDHEIEMGLFRMPSPDFNKRAVREAIVNAFSHRDYSKMGRVRIAITDEGLTVANPGGFIEGISIDNLLTAEPHGRNPLLADALKRVGLAEKTGRGIDRIFEGSLIYGRLLPDYSASTNVTVSLFIPRSTPDIQMAKLIADEQNRLGRPLPVNTLLILNTLRDMPKSDVKQISESVRLPETVVRTILEKSITAGLVEAYGNARGRSYMLSHTIYKENDGKIGYVRQRDIDTTRYLELILTLAKQNEYISRADVVKLLHVSEPYAYRLLKKLVDAKQLVAVNKGRYSKYKLFTA